MSYLGPNTRNKSPIINYISNGSANEGNDTLSNPVGYAEYAETDAVTFTDAGDLVTLVGHGLSGSTAISFTSITSTTGISINTTYYPVTITPSTFQLSATVGGAVLPLTTNGSGTMVRSVPKLGTGGSPVVTFSRNTTTPIRSGADFRFVKGAVNGMGQGVSYDFTVDTADLGKVLTVTFDYTLITATNTYANADLTVYLIQDPSGTPVVIQPAGYVIQSVSQNTQVKQIATFQTASNATSYRLCVHVSSINATAYTLAVDNISVGPQVVQYGAPVTDWVSYTLVVGGTTTAPTPGTVIVNSAKWRRVGDTMEIMYQYEQAAAGLMGSGEYLFPMPAGYSIDTTKLSILNPARTVVGNAKLSFGLLSSGATTPPATVIVGSTNPNAFKINFIQTSVENTASVGSGAYGFNTANISYSFLAKVPITGWSSSVQMSNDTDTRVVASTMTSSSVAAPLTSVNTKIVGFASAIDTHGGWDSGNQRYVVPVAGVYSIWFNALFSSVATAGSGSIQTRIHVNTVQAHISINGAGGTAAQTRAALASFELNLRAGDLVEFYVYQDTGTALTLSGFTNASIKRLSGPSAIAASETVAARYESTGNRTPTSSKSVNYDTKIFDTHGAVTTVVGDIAGWKFTAPIAGKYSVSVSTFSSVAVGGSLYVAKGSSTIVSWLVTHNVAGVTLSGTALVDVVAGEIIDIRSDAAPTLNNVTAHILSVSIHRLGN